MDEKKLREVQLDILKRFIEVCDGLGLKWFLAYGSCLGAVRHGGYIPWDDDIDVAMPRADYEKFLEAAPEKLGENYFLQTAKTDPDYPQCFAKIRRSDTTFIETSVKDFKINHGIYIDIFPVTEYRPSRLFDLKAKYYDLCVSRSYFVPERKKSPKSILKAILCSPIRDYRVARDRKEKLIKRAATEGTGVCSTLCGIWRTGENVPTSIFDGVKKVPFEDLEANIPEKYGEYLTLIYGDYMTLPPEEQRVAHHYCEVINPERSYKEYIRTEDEK